MVISCSPIGLDHAGDRGGGLGQRGVEAVALPRDGIGGAGGVESLVDLGADQRGVGQQRGDVVPDDLVEVVGADRLVGADPAALVAVVVRAQAPVVVDLLVGGAGRGAVVAVAAACAGGQALQQRRDLGCCGRRNACCRPAGWATRSKVSRADDGRHRDRGPLARGAGRRSWMRAGWPGPAGGRRGSGPADSCTTMVLPNTAVPA